MKENKTVFQIAVAVIFALMLIVGFVLFATYRPSATKDEERIGNVVI
jgi:hypothetical protein